MKTDAVFYTTAPIGAVLFLDALPVQASTTRSRIYDAWHAFDPEPTLPSTPLRWLALTQRHAALAAFPTLTGASDDA